MTIAAGAWSWMTPFSLFIQNTLKKQHRLSDAAFRKNKTPCTSAQEVRLYLNELYNRDFWIATVSDKKVKKFTK